MHASGLSSDVFFGLGKKRKIYFKHLVTCFWHDHQFYYSTALQLRVVRDWARCPQFYRWGVLALTDTSSDLRSKLLCHRLSSTKEERASTFPGFLISGRNRTLFPFHMVFSTYQNCFRKPPGSSIQLHLSLLSVTRWVGRSLSSRLSTV